MSSSPPDNGFPDPFEPIKRMWASLGVPLPAIPTMPSMPPTPSTAGMPGIPSMPGFGANPGGAFGMNMMFPTTDVAEIERRIADLRSVETWLNLNLGILRTTIQGLDAQRTTLEAFRSMHAQMSKAVAAAAPGMANESPPKTAAPTASTTSAKPRRRKGNAR